MSYDIVKSAGQAIQQFGGQDDIDVVVDRMKIMLKSAQLSPWQQSAKFRDTAKANLRTALVQAAQVSVFYGLVPGVDLHLIPFGNDWSVDVGFESWKRAADQFCEDHGITYHAADVDLSPDDVKEKRGKDYDPGDVGVKIIFMRSDKEHVYDRMEKMGLKPEQIYTVTYGYWRKKANYDKGNSKWNSDNVPVHRDRRWVAWKRAFKAALKAEFSLQVLAANNRREFDYRKAQLGSELQYQEVSHTMVVDKPQQREDDGDIMFMTDDTPSRNGNVEDAKFREVKPEADKPKPSKIKLAGTALTFAEWCQTKDSPNTSPCTEKQYGFLSRLINDIADKDCADRVLSVLLSREVDNQKANRPGGELSSKLIGWLKQGDDHRQDYADVIKEIADLV